MMSTNKKSKTKDSSATATMTTQHFLDRHRTVITNKALAVHNKFIGLEPRWKAAYEENEALTGKLKGRKHLQQSPLVPPLSQAANLLATRFKAMSGTFTDALRRGDGYKTTKVIKALQEDADLMETIITNLEREIARFRKTVDAGKGVSKKKKKKKTLKTIVEV